MKILIIAADFPPWDGGISQVGYEYARVLAAWDHQVTVLAPRYDAMGATAQWDACQPFRISRYRSHKSFFIHYWMLRFKLHRHLTQQDYDWILCMRWNHDGIALLPALKHHGAVFQWFHGGELFDRHLANPKWKSRLNLLMQQTSVNIAVSQYTAGLVRQYFPGCPNLKTVYLGVDAQRFVPPDSIVQAKAALGLEGKKVLLTMARLVPRKGQALVLQSIADLKDDSIIYIIGGKGRYEAELKSMATELGIADSVRFTGFIAEEEKVAYYQASDIFVMPSQSENQVGEVEGFGLTYLEANACGKPVIAGNQGGCPEAVDHGVSGLLVDPNSKDALSTAIVNLLTNQAQYQSMADHARKRVEDSFTWDSSCRRLLDLYKNRMA